VASDSSMCPGVDSVSKNEYQVKGKGGRCVRLTTYHLHVPMSRNLGALTSWNPVGLFKPVMGQLYILWLSVVWCHKFRCLCSKLPDVTFQKTVVFGLMLLCRWGQAVAQLVEALRYNLMESLRIFTNLILPAAVWSWCRFSLQQQ
jgi:hypothetical protein